MIALGIVPVGIMISAGQWLPEAPPVDCFGPSGFDDSDGCGIGSRMEVQFVFFWAFLSVFMLGIGAWFVVAGAKSKAIVSKPAHSQSGF